MFDFPKEASHLAFRSPRIGCGVELQFPRAPENHSVGCLLVIRSLGRRDVELQRSWYYAKLILPERCMDSIDKFVVVETAIPAPFPEMHCERMFA
jgi:hypothetical protein